MRSLQTAWDLFTTLSVLLLAWSCSAPGREVPPTGGEVAISVEDTPFPVLVGPYLGQPPALSEPTVFAPGIVSTGFAERDVAMMPGGSEIYWGVTGNNYIWSTVLHSRLVDGRWTEPEAAPCCLGPGFFDL